jgi:hypothetical protein
VTSSRCAEPKIGADAVGAFFDFGQQFNRQTLIGASFRKVKARSVDWISPTDSVAMPDWLFVRLRR